MSLEFEIPLVSFIFIFILSIVYFSKKKVDLIENKAYKIILICSLVVSLIDLIIHVICALNSFSIIESSYYTLFNYLNKVLSMLFIVIFSCLFYYIAIITYRNYQKNAKKILIPILILNIISAVILFFTDIKLVEVGNVTNVTGPTATFGYFIVAILLSLSLIISIVNIKLVDRRYISIFSILVIMGVLYTLTLVWPGIIIYDLVLALLCYIMYFTIENPDLKTVNELLRNKELVEKGMEDKSRFLFEMSQEVKEPAKNILGITKNYDKLENDIDKKDAVRLIASNANDLLFKLNNVLNISTMDASKIKIKEDDYNTNTLLNGIKNIAQNKIERKDIKLNFDISSNVPGRLNGDDIRLKQILSSILFNSISNTENGFINVYVDAIVRYDVCRLIIKVEDSGVGMSLEKINSILDDNQELADEDVRKLDGLDVDLKVATKIIKLLGGSLNIKSKENKGTTFTVVLDQKCELEKTTDVMKNVEKYSSDVFGRKRVLIVNDDKEELFKISNLLSKYNVDINTTMMGKECIDKISSGEFYNLIIIDDELRTTSALNVLNKLKETRKFKTDVIVMLERDKERFKEYYINDGFKDVIFKANLTEEVDRIVNKYL